MRNIIKRFAEIMMQQFQHLFQENGQTHNKTQDILKSIQDLILNSLENLFPPEYDFSNLTTLYDNPTITNNPPLLTYHLVDYFVQMIENNFISIHSYHSLEAQTQKLQSTIRSHIKLEQEVKLYLEHLEAKLNKYEHYINRFIKHSRESKRNSFNEQMPTERETHLMRQRLNFIRTNEQLSRKLQQKQEEIKQMKELNSNHIEIKQNFIEKDKLNISKSEQKIYHKRHPTHEANGSNLQLQHPLLFRLKTPSVLGEKLMLQNMSNAKSSVNLLSVAN